MSKVENTETDEPEVKKCKIIASLCSHYTRRCYLICTDCNKLATCRICHDENVINHQLNRHAVKQVVCAKCNQRQKSSNKCVKCETNFGKYSCLKCNFFDDNEKGQFHCDGCGVCRVGGKDNFFHCDTCGLCLAKCLKNNHKCIEKVSHGSCSICCYDLHTSLEDVKIMNCGHLIHTSCYHSLIRSNMSRCPICLKSIGNKEQQQMRWNYVDQVIRESPMPREYRDVIKYILCYDCGEKSQAKFHMIGLKCGMENCGSYNTTEYKPQDGSNEVVRDQQESQDQQEE